MRRVGWFLSRTAVPLLAASLLFLAGCENSLTEITTEDIEPLYDEIVCAESHNDGCTGGGGDWPGDPDPPPYGGGDTCPSSGCDGGGGGGGGGGSGGDRSYPTSLDHAHFEGSQASTPNCERRDTLQPEEVAWCGGFYPDAEKKKQLEDMAEDIIERCDYLEQPWGRVDGNIKFFSHNGEDFLGAAPIRGIWIVMSTRGWSLDKELMFAHELMHIWGYRHRTDEEKRVFNEQERKCTGGSSTKWS